MSRAHNGFVCRPNVNAQSDFVGPYGFLGFGGITILETHWVGPGTFSITPAASCLAISFAIFGADEKENDCVSLY